jgi:hypothetical protein
MRRPSMRSNWTYELRSSEHNVNRSPRRSSQVASVPTVYEIKKPGKGLPRYYSRDIDQHNGGVFKGANRIEDLWRKDTRSGTYGLDIDENGMVIGLVRVGD